MDIANTTAMAGNGGRPVIRAGAASYVLPCIARVCAFIRMRVVARLCVWVCTCVRVFMRVYLCACVCANERVCMRAERNKTESSQA